MTHTAAAYSSVKIKHSFNDQYIYYLFLHMNIYYVQVKDYDSQGLCYIRAALYASGFREITEKQHELMMNVSRCINIIFYSTPHPKVHRSEICTKHVCLQRILLILTHTCMLGIVRVHIVLQLKRSRTN